MIENIPYKVERILSELSVNGTGRKLLTVTAWKNVPAKLDLRKWILADDGKEHPGKGITLTDAEAENLSHGLEKYLKQK